MLTFPQIDPVAIAIGPLAIRWYALAYIAGVVLGLLYAAHLARRTGGAVTPRAVEDSLSWLVLGIILGGRAGYVLFYNLEFYSQNLIDILKIWHGGMAFHGGLAGVLIASLLFCRRRKLSYFAFTDIIAPAVPIGLFFGRLANFVNGELFGRVSNAQWAMVFPNGGELPRHPSQLYQAGMEGFLLFVILAICAHQPKIMARRGMISGLFLMLYGFFRAIGEVFREPDIQVGFLAGGATMGQVLCIPMVLFGLYLVLRARRTNPPPASPAA
jgi:phosphatidylglycerol:prolipoprotein diacylglycerol transferase